uniref:Uncharacterized protein n=1 Tax=Oryza meridionalis TaxID=40149 RepID=A0A0E0ERC8_9ORYZ
MAASGGYRLLQSVRNAYAMGKVRMVASEFETATRVVKNSGPSGRDVASVEQGGFVLWQMAPDMWYVELPVGGSKVHMGSNGRLVWHHTPWLGAHAAKGPVRLLRRVPASSRSEHLTFSTSPPGPVAARAGEEGRGRRRLGGGVRRWRAWSPPRQGRRGRCLAEVVAGLARLQEEKMDRGEERREGERRREQCNYH